MLLKRSIKKIILSAFALILLFLMYLIPNNNISDQYDYVVEYVNKDLITHDIFLLDNNNYISKTKIIVSSKEKEDLVKEIIEAITINSAKQDQIPSGFKAILNENTKINKLEIKDDLIKIDFNESLLDVNNEEQVIEAIVYNLTSIEGIKNILIYIDGKLLTYIPKSKITLPSVLNRNYGINKEYHLTSNKNITKTTIYYISKFNDNIYYTPVTKISNDLNDKAQIIVEELADNVSNDLGSYLNYNTKLVSMEINQDNLILNFNDYILSDKDNLKILDEVTDTISLSVFDNYDVNNVVFEVNGKEICKKENKTLE